VGPEIEPVMAGERSDQSCEGGKRTVESAILAIVLESYPRPLPWPALLAEMTADVGGPDRIADIERAVDGLVAVDLLRSGDGALSPTAAALRSGELELGL
jgi:hypothetical protein